VSDRLTFRLINARVRQNALEAVRTAPEGYRVVIGQPQRSLDQNARLHAMLTDLAASPVTWAGKRRTMEEWKAIIVSGHSVATGNGGEVIPGIEGEFVAIRESTASMSVARAASLIDYLEAFCVSNGVELKETRAGGFMDEVAA
jgi:hypothetical protein